MKQNERQLGDRWRTGIYFPCSLDVPTQTTVEDELIREIRIRNEGLVTDGHRQRPSACELFTARENIVAASASESGSCHVKTIVATNQTRPAVISLTPATAVTWSFFVSDCSDAADGSNFRSFYRLLSRARFSETDSVCS